MESGTTQPRRVEPVRVRGVEVAARRGFWARAGGRADETRDVLPVRLLAVAPCRDVVLDAMSPEVLCEGQRYRKRLVRLHRG